MDHDTCPLCGDRVTTEDIETSKTEWIKNQLYHKSCMVELGKTMSRLLWNEK